MNAFPQLIEENDRLRALIARWRATPQSVAELLPAAAEVLRATAAAKEQELYPAVLRHDPRRADRVDEAVRTNQQVEAFLSAALQSGPEGRGFLDDAYEAAAAADGLLLHERRDLLPALEGDDVPETELDRVVGRLRTARSDYLNDHRADRSHDAPAGSDDLGH
ncbi:hemerythrin domain-containing protein [Streptodolium elevatio]|uniref:Hemerythrin domain-containing protein n=1 Tax=Streptodolium elevatio TaxID=3157996 RepID=A0ABV3DQQ0_9ACTN